MITPDDIQLDCDVTLRTLAKWIERHLKEQDFCVLSQDDVERCWPGKTTRGTARETLIHEFARACGWRVFIHNPDSGPTAAILWAKS